MRASPNQRAGVSLSLTGLGFLYLKYGRFAQAAEFYKRALATDEKAFGPNSDDASSQLSNLAGVYDWQGKYEDAERLYKRALPIQEKIGGLNSLPVAILLNNLATLYSHQGRHAEAEALYLRARPIYEKVHGNDPWTAQILSSLASTQQAQGRYAEAEVLRRRSLDIDERAFGQDSAIVGAGLGEIGILREAQGKYPEAEATLRQAVAIMERRTGANNFDAARVLDHLGAVLRAQGKHAEAEPALKRALAIRERTLGANHPDVAVTLDNLAVLYGASGDDKNALAYSRRASAAAIARATIGGSGPPDLSGGLVNARAGYFRRHIANLATAARKGLEPLPALRGEALEMAQRAVQSSTGTAVDQMALRFASGDGTLASLVRERQDLAAAARANDKLLVDALSRPEGQPNQVAIENVRRQIALSESKIAAVSARLEKEFPDFAALANPKPLKADEVQTLLGTDEALMLLLSGGSESYIFVLTRDGYDWRTIPLGNEAIAQKVALFRRGLEVDALRRGLKRPECSEAEASKRGLSRGDCDASVAGRRDLFDLSRAYELYQVLFGPIEPMIKDKHHLLVVPSGALTALPLHLLVTGKPAVSVPLYGDEITTATFAPYRDAAWLIKRQAVTVLPSVTSLKALRGLTRNDEGSKPMIGFGDPVFNPETDQGAAGMQASMARGLATRSFTEFWRGASIDRDELAKALPRLVETSDELKRVAASLGAPTGDIFLREAASETSVKRATLSDYRIVYFATHGLVAGEVKGLAEPSLALTLPRQPSELDDGLLTASEIAQLKLNADWVVLSACNTIAGDRPGAEALSGLARAFFYAGARALLVSHWSVDSNAATRLTTSTFDLIRADPKLRRAEALRRAMLAYMADTTIPLNAYPALWGPFEIVGEGTIR